VLVDLLLLILTPSLILSWCKLLHYYMLLLLEQKYDLVQQFRVAGITAVLNLTEPGEHPHCGDGLEQNSGYVHLCTRCSCGIAHVMQVCITVV
jgi:hypothetical protein